MRRSLRGPAGLLVCLALLSPPVAYCADPAAGGDFELERDSVYNHITVRQEGLRRCMLFGRRNQLQQTCVDVLQPAKPLFEYTSMMCVAFLFAPAPKRCALLGLGGGYLPLLFQKYYPDVTLDVVEIDKVVVELARKHFFFAETPKMSCKVADGRQFLKNSRQKYDQIWIDAFNGDYIPAHMTTREFLEVVRERLSDAGVVVQNVHHTHALYDALVATFRAVFPTVYVFSGERSGNSVLLAANRKLKDPGELFRELHRARKPLRLGDVDLLEELGKYEANPSTRKEKVLTDDYSPANLLMFKERREP